MVNMLFPGVHFLLRPDNDIGTALKVPITTAADDIHKCFFIVFQRK